jgi:hypothetical protein
MKRFRFHIGTLVILVLVLAVCFAAFRESTENWDSSIFTLTLGVLLTSILLAVHSSESRRAFSIGFALFGWVYLGLSLVPSIESRLITTKALAYLDSKVPGRASEISEIRILRNLLSSPSNSLQSFDINAVGDLLYASHPIQMRLWNVVKSRLFGGWSGTTENFVRIGHSLFALVTGWLGGQLSRRLCRVSSHVEPSTAVDVEGTNL